MRLAVEDWEYVGEGKVRVALANLNKRSETFGSVLLFQKVSSSSAALKQQTNAEKDVRFIKSVMLHWYTTNYVFGEINSIMVTDSVREEILRKIDKRRPPSRISEGVPTVLHRNACLQRNYAILHRAIPKNEIASEDELNFEIKVKCGLTATTPFVVDTAADIKTLMSRYHIMQLYKQAKTNSKTDWGTFVGVNSYDPLDITSGDPVRIRTAICTLLSNPQNNLRVSLNSRHIYGWDKQDLNMLYGCLRGSNVVEPAAAASHDTHNTAFDVLGQPGHIIDALAAVLSEETVLRRLRDMQKLDLLDSEGAAVVYARLVEVLGSMERAMELLEEKMISSVDPDLCELIESQSFECGQSNECLSFARTLFALRLSPQMNEAERRIQLTRAFEAVGRASAEQCLYVLQLWMLALIAKDASVMVTVRRIRASALPLPGRQVGDMWVSPQSPTHCGTVYHNLKLHNCDTGCAGFVYTVGLIDLGLKSLDKVWRKAAEDANVCKVVRNSQLS